MIGTKILKINSDSEIIEVKVATCHMEIIRSDRISRLYIVNSV